MKKLLSILACCGMLACGNSQRNKQPEQTAVPPTEDSAVQTTGVNPPAVSTEEQQFKTFFTAFRSAVENRQDTLLEGLIHFPLPVDNVGGEVKKKEFRSREKEIFSGDVLHQLPKVSDENITGIEENNPTAYYKKLRMGTDPGSALYEVHMEYPEPNSARQGFFTLVFGKVDGTYKLIGYHRNMPVKE